MRRGGACPAVLQENRQEAVREGLLFVFHDKFIVICAVFYYNIRIECETDSVRRKDVRHGLPNPISALASVRL